MTRGWLGRLSRPGASRGRLPRPGASRGRLPRPGASRSRLPRLRTRRGIVVTAIAALVLVAVGVGIAASSRAPRVRTVSAFVTGTPEGAQPVRLDTTLYLPAHTPAPAVLLAQGFGGDKTSLAGEGRTLAEHGYVALAYSARGFGESGGLIHLDSPRYEVDDARLLVDHLASLPQVEPDEIGVAGSSYGGALALLLAGTDRRIASVAADITWNDLRRALFPNAAGSAPGVFKKLWVGELFQNAFGRGGSTRCGRLAPALCAAYQSAARTGRPDTAMLRILRAASPSTVLAHVTAPTLLTQGEDDSLFPLSEADANARGIAAAGTPVRVVWRAGGHDDPADGTATATDAALDWFARTLHGSRPPTRQPFAVSEPGDISAETGLVARQVLRTGRYPGLDGSAHDTVPVAGPPRTVVAPAGGSPAAVTDLPGLGPLAALGASPVAAISSQTAAFASAPLRHALDVVGSPTIRLTVTTHSSTDATLFAAVIDVDGDATPTLPQSLVAPLRLTGLRPGAPRTVTVRLPAIVHSFAKGHRLVVTVATTDAAYSLPDGQRLYTVGVAGRLRVPLVPGRVVRAGHPVVWLVVGLAAALVALLAVGLVLRRRRVARPVRRPVRPPVERPVEADVPVVVDGLVKQYAGGYRAVDGVGFRVERGQVVGLLGPNGAGKTTTLRMLVGLVVATAGSAHVFGEPIVPGAPVLARVGAFIEGPGFLPHLTGRQNLQLCWASTGRPRAQARFDVALDIAGLGASVDRRVKTYSNGMRQRLGIAQAMLGLPELLVLDEPTNGLDPPQIAEMRQVMRGYAATGRTVIVSSHLLAEVEQTCTHVVVMHRGRLVAAGAVSEIVGTDGVTLAVDDPDRAAEVLATAGIAVERVPARRALEDVFLDLIGDGQ